MFAEIPSYLPWALTVAALSLVFVQGLVLGRQVRSLRATLKERCDTLGGVITITIVINTTELIAVQTARGRNHINSVKCDGSCTCTAS